MFELLKLFEIQVLQCNFRFYLDFSALLLRLGRCKNFDAVWCRGNVFDRFDFKSNYSDRFAATKLESLLINSIYSNRELHSEIIQPADRSRQGVCVRTGDTMLSSRWSAVGAY